MYIVLKVFIKTRFSCLVNVSSRHRLSLVLHITSYLTRQFLCLYKLLNKTIIKKIKDILKLYTVECRYQ